MKKPHYSLVEVISPTMRFLSVVLLTVLVCSVLSRGRRIKRLQKNIHALEGSLADITTQIDAMKAERAELDKDHAWQSMHMAAAAACRGSTATGGTGPWGNAVLAKDASKSCSEVCARSPFKLCDADVAISGYKGQAGSYTQRLGHFYNYGCAYTKFGNRVEFDEVRANGNDVFLDFSSGKWYYRYCCCRKA